MANQPKKDKKTEKDETKVGPRRPLLRSRDDRKIWGVAGGLAEHVGFNPTLVRIFFVVTTLLRRRRPARLPGAGGRPPRRRRDRPAGGRERLVAARQGGARLRPGRGGALPRGRPRGGERLGHSDGPWHRHRHSGDRVRPRPRGGGIRRRHPPAHRPPARGRRHWCWGSRPAAVAAADIHIDESIGQRTYTPTVAADIPADGYRLGTGQLVVDLRSLPWANGQTIPASAHLGIGQMIVSVPPNVCIDGDVHGKAGELIVRRPGHPRGRPGHRSGITAHRCSDAQAERRHPVRADADHGRGARSDRHPWRRLRPPPTGRGHPEAGLREVILRL